MIKLNQTMARSPIADAMIELWQTNQKTQRMLPKTKAPECRAGIPVIVNILSETWPSDFSRVRRVKCPRKSHSALRAC
jgi:hypothetical protein